MGRTVGFQCCVGDTLGIPGTPLESWGLGCGTHWGSPVPSSPRDKVTVMGRTVGFQCCAGDTLGIPGTPIESRGLGDGKDNGIQCSGVLELRLLWTLE